MEKFGVAPTVRQPGERFTGDVYLTPISAQADPTLIAGLVRFTPGARTNWHSHERGQLLYIVEGQGIVAGRDGAALRVRAGDAVWTPPGEEHWHGGTSTTMMAHVAMLEAGTTGGSTWLEAVSDAEYEEAQA